MESNKEIVEYILIFDINNLQRFNKKVNDKIKDGWQPYGTHPIVPTNVGLKYYSQAMVKYKK